MARPSPTCEACYTGRSEPADLPQPTHSTPACLVESRRLHQGDACHLQPLLNTRQQPHVTRCYVTNSHTYINVLVPAPAAHELLQTPTTVLMMLCVSQVEGLTPPGGPAEPGHRLRRNLAMRPLPQGRVTPTAWSICSHDGL